MFDNVDLEPASKASGDNLNFETSLKSSGASRPKRTGCGPPMWILKPVSKTSGGNLNFETSLKIFWGQPPKTNLVWTSGLKIEIVIRCLIHARVRVAWLVGLSLIHI